VLSALFKEQYLDEYNLDPSVFMGRVMNRIIAPGHKFTVESDGVNIVTENYIGDIFRSTNNPLADPIAPDRFDAQKYKIRYAESGTNNDFMSVDGSVQVSDLELNKLIDRDGAAYVPVVERLMKSAAMDYESKMAIWRSTPRSGLLGTVSGNIITGAGTYEFAGGSYASASDDVRFKVDGGAFAAFRRGMKILIYEGGGSSPKTARIVGFPNSSDNSIRVATTDGSNFSATETAYNGGEIYFSGATSSTNYGMYGFDEWASTPASGESFIGGKDRTSADFGFLNMQRIKATASGTVKIARKHLDQLAQAMQNAVALEHETMRILASVDVVNTLRSSVGEDAFTTADISGEKTAAFGTIELVYQHPFLGRVIVNGDPLVNPNKVYAIAPTTWRTAMIDNVAKAGFRVLPGEGPGGWYRTSAAGGGAESRSKHWRLDMANSGLADVCLTPEMNAVLLNIKA